MGYTATIGLRAFSLGLLTTLGASSAFAQGVDGAPVGEMEELVPSEPEAAPASPPPVSEQAVSRELTEQRAKLKAAYSRHLRQDRSLYVAMGVGFAQLITAGSSERQLSGAGLATNLGVGTALSPNVVVGGALMGIWVPNGNTRIGDAAPNLSPTANQGTLGPYLMYYPWDENGVYVLVAMGVSGMFVASGTAQNDGVTDSVDSVASFGLSEAIGVGLDWAGDSGVGISAVGRLVAAQFFSQPTDVAFGTAFIPGLSLNVAYH